jgi:hypothetical protein
MAANEVLGKTKEEWFRSFDLEGLENVRNDYHQGNWRNQDPRLHQWAKEWLSNHISMTEAASRKQFRITQGIALASALAAIAAAIAAFLAVR